MKYIEENSNPYIIFWRDSELSIAASPFETGQARELSTAHALQACLKVKGGGKGWAVRLPGFDHVLQHKYC